MDVHRATDAVLTELDRLAANHPQLLFLATSNFAGAIDEAFLSRADLGAVTIDLPTTEACSADFPSSTRWRGVLAEPILG